MHIKLKSGWTVDNEDSLYFVAPDGYIFDRCGYELRSRSSQMGKITADLKSIFTAEEWESYFNSFDH